MFSSTSLSRSWKDHFRMRRMTHSLLLTLHLIGPALGIGCATAKLALLLKCKAEEALLPAYLAVVKPITRLIVVGLVLLTGSGIGWLWLGYPLTPRLVTKLTLVAVIFVLGAIIDTVIEPKFRMLAPRPGESASPTYVRVERRYLALEVTAAGLFYFIVIMWILV